MGSSTIEACHATDEVDALFAALGDADCRSIVLATADRALTAAELASALDLPVSTVYRKLECLLEAALLSEAYRLTSKGHHPAEFRCGVDRIRVALPKGPDGRIEIELVGHPRRRSSDPFAEARVR